MKGGIQMKINITPPKYYSGYKLHNMTKKYMKGEYNRTKAWNIFEGEKKGYYLYICKRILGQRNQMQVKFWRNIIRLKN